MARTLVVPGVSVETRFDVAPPLPARSGILGAIGVTDRDPGGLRSVTSAAEAIALYGAATRFSFPELFSALENGVSEAFVAPVATGSGRPAELRLRDDDGDAAVILRARAPGPWGNRLSARVVRSIANDGRTVRRVSVEILHDGTPIERHDGLVLRPGDDSDLFAAINRDSGAVVAIDPVLETDPPAVDAAVVGFTDAPAAAATGAITQPGTPRPPLVNIAAARAGEAGNRIAISVRAGRAVAVFNDAALRPSLRVLAERAGAAGADIAIGIAAEAGGSIGITVQGAGGAVRTYAGLASIAAAVSALDADPDVIAERAGDVLPAATAQPRVNLAPTVSVTVTEEGLRSAEFADLPTAQAMVTALDADPAITATLAGNAAQLPDINAANSFFLAGGRDAGPARSYEGRNNPGVPVLELTPAPESDAAGTRFRVLRGTNDALVRIIAGVAAPDGFLQQEVFEDLSMDPDHPNFLPAALATSRLLRATDRFVRSGASVWPVASFAPQAFTGGAMPGLPAWRDAIGTLANEEAVDMLIAGLQAFGDPTLDGVAVQQAMLGAARSASDNAAPRFVVGSIRPSANRDVAAILDHVQLVADRRFMLCAPAGVDGAIAGLLGHLDYFQSPTFKTLASPGAPLVPYSEGELNKLVGPNGNICVVLSKRGRGTICVKGIAADGFQISVVRVADRCTREVKKIADRFIGELNNAEQRNALRQMIVERFTAMQREGALVPSTDGKDPAFLVDVFASQTDAAGGIVRVDIAVRPVRAIDFVYATIRVKN